MTSIPPTRLPCAELHLHLEGTLEPETIFALAERNRIDLEYPDVETLSAQYEFSDLQSFLNLYYANMATLRTAVDFAEMTDAYLARAAGAGVRHAEVFLDPQAHLVRGVALEEVMDGVSTALGSSMATHGISSGLIVTMLRDHTAQSAMDVLEAVLALGTPILGIGLDSAEVGHPPSKFVNVFARARAEGLHVVAHAGEEGPPAYVWEALDLLQVERIDHGIRCLEDDGLVERLVAERIPLTVCPLSNVRLRVVDEIGAHPLPAMLARGLNVTVNSDDPAYFGGYLDDNLTAVRDAFDLDPAVLTTLARNSVDASFADDARKAALHAEIARAAG
ncbi:adenine deaminase [Mycolicibacterium madagascariense]|uniref:Adenine deaminase n=1 Tax=Mycolicibacterium madagascariense TaxID=212765 RepID=A0A7I7XJX0_9MYCO|nr:adenosine deaminase [Mycolicibacterium madagascariense]MCV7012964.1 adenosine deaminase [Mycolicibacterium madagascariense]BBZ29462.1 adenine deaminase [Mycolicibacterium madagascariense]